MVTHVADGKRIVEAPYSQAELDTIVNNVRIEERYIANMVLGDLGIPAERRPKIYNDAGKIIMDIILAPPKAEPEVGKDS